MHGIVVGVSASTAGAAALDWALQQAALRKVALTAVRAWDIPAYGPYYSVGSALRSTSPDFQLTELKIARDALAQAVQRVPGAADVQATAVATRGRPPEVLVAAAKQAELLVLGTRGVGALSRVVHLGSVASSVLHHAHGPVAVIPDKAHETPGSAAPPSSCCRSPATATTRPRRLRVAAAGLDEQPGRRPLHPAGRRGAAGVAAGRGLSAAARGKRHIRGRPGTLLRDGRFTQRDRTPGDPATTGTQKAAS